MTQLEFFRLQTRQEVLALYDRFAPVGVEEVELAAACGRVLAAPITAPEEVPGFLRATMDGYAVRAQDTFGASVGAPQYLEIKGEVPMGVAPTRGVGRGETLRVPTGAMLPTGRRRGGDDRIHRRAPGRHPGGAPGRGPRGKCPARPGRTWPGGRRSFRPAAASAPRRSASWPPWEFFVWWFTKDPG